MVLLLMPMMLLMSSCIVILRNNKTTNNKQTNNEQRTTTNNKQHNSTTAQQQQQQQHTQQPHNNNNTIWRGSVLTGEELPRPLWRVQVQHASTWRCAGASAPDHQGHRGPCGAGLVQFLDQVLDVPVAVLVRFGAEKETVEAPQLPRGSGPI